MYINGKWYEEPEANAYVKNLKELLKQAAETIERLGTGAQDCMTCARLPLCNVFKNGNGYENCFYKWAHADEAAEA